ncbi:MAG: cation transporter [Ignavibacteriales bacterium]|jgi:Copper chaperone|nr:MAG: heavy-metal-associated domain-containing protein [Ignavibacteriaceae bacterium]MBW7874075.1 heavy-metal-associated domain-containing protein [Ignavibacteria bacterium]MCZ2143175.1 cation transporter [Ignavibacteriales bacterium]OQY74661.1 MAG: hypothetical protein B6D45_06520 [Ignavibacteriales bacterium UTCHB3]MBV6444056.1 Copper chaperone CopZ [Ignavibacteriaceae bacterium]
MKTIKLKIDGMSCQHCVKAVEVELSELHVNVLGVQIGSAEVRFDSAKVKQSDIEDAVKNAGYSVVSVEEVEG